MSQSIIGTTSYRRRLPSGTSKTGRRQYRSCDQCRKGKRACDIVLSEEPVSSQSAAPCSNCAKTRKPCTLVWLNSSLLSVAKGKERRDSSQNQQQMVEQHMERETSWEGALTNLDDNLDPEPGNTINTSLELPLSPPSDQTFLGVPGQEFCSTDPTCSESLLDTTFIYGYETGSIETGLSNCGDTVSALAGTGSGYDSSIFSHNLTTPENTFYPSAYKKSTPPRERSPKRRRSKLSLSPGPGADRTNGQRNLMLCQTSSHHRNLRTPSPLSLEHRIALGYSKASISSGLVRIYHDSMENALSCWLTESTCPYSITQKTIASQNGCSLDDSPGERFGNEWSNRICERVCHLDKVFSTLRTRQLTAFEDKAVDMALKKSITAFATQWANSSERSSAQFPTGFSNPTNSNTTSPVEFDRSIQESSWHEAKNALQNTAEIESFRVIFAHVIFALTQKPLNAEEKLRELTDETARVSNIYREEEIRHETYHDNRARETSQNLGPTGITATSGLNAVPEPTLLEKVLDLNGPPVFLETALRQIYSIRCKIEKIESRARRSMKSHERPGSSNTRTAVLNPKDRQTFDFLFWLCVMFDTLSSAITLRPLVVSDEDSDVHHSPAHKNDDSDVKFAVQYSSDSSVQINISQDRQALEKDNTNLWDELLLNKFAKNMPQQKRSVLRWPCSYEAAESALCDAAPIKVLLYRKITRLQTLLTRQAGSQKLECAISDALEIRDHWNKSYGPFFNDCIQQHESLPPRIQSWYIVLCGHWHLAGLLLADLIDDMDDQEMTAGPERLKRRQSGLVENIRREDAYAVSDLGSASCPRTSESFSQAKEFHSAVNKGALLTEPWTDVLVRSFSKAGTALIDMFPEAAIAGSFEEVKTRCEVCVEALWHLGKKSDIASLASQVLQEELKGRIIAMNAASLGSDSNAGPETAGFDAWHDPWDINSFEHLDDSHSTPLVFLENVVTAW